MNRAGLAALAVTAATMAHAAPAKRPGAVVRVEHRDPSTLPAKGPSNALVTIEVFFTPLPAFRIGSVYGTSFAAVERLQQAHPSRVRIVYRVLKGSSARFPYAALYAYSEGKFFEFLEALNRAPTRALSDENLLELAKKVGLDPERLANVISKPPAAYDEMLDDNQRRMRRRIGYNPSLPVTLWNGRPLGASLGALSPQSLEKEYEAALDRAYDLIDHGVARSELAAAFDEIVQLRSHADVPSGATDEEIDDVPVTAPLADPPLDYRGLPAHGTPHADITVAVLCSPTSSNCIAPLATAQRVADLYPDEVRVVWAPYFDVGRENAADLSMLSDAALCAERDGGRATDRDDAWDPQDSTGWRWVREMLAQSALRQPLSADERIDRVASKLRVEPRAFAACRAQLAGHSIDWIETARRAGVQTSPATIVNGRSYGPINDLSTLQALVDAELAPGLLSPAWSQPEVVDAP